MKTLALTIHFEDGVDTRATRQFIEGALSHFPGVRGMTVQQPPEVLPLVSVDSEEEQSPLMIRLEYLCPQQLLKQHHLPLHDLHKLPPLTPAAALRLLKVPVPYTQALRTEMDYLAALMHASRPLDPSA
jgi:hypothetical protein